MANSKSTNRDDLSHEIISREEFYETHRSNCLYLAGQRFGRLVALRPTRKGGRVAWLCKCDCGKTNIVPTGNLRGGQTRSCGCYASDSVAERNRTHGMNMTTEHITWKAMKARCSNDNQECYERYGGRGIKVCDRWQDFENFYEDMGPRPSPEHSLDRIDNNGDYSPENCRWATRRQQNKNRRNKVEVTFRGETKWLPDWADELDVDYCLLYSRLFHCEWPVERAFTEGIE